MSEHLQHLDCLHSLHDEHVSYRILDIDVLQGSLVEVPVEAKGWLGYSVGQSISWLHGSTFIHPEDYSWCTTQLGGTIESDDRGNFLLTGCGVSFSGIQSIEGGFIVLRPRSRVILSALSTCDKTPCIPTFKIVLEFIKAKPRERCSALGHRLSPNCVVDSRPVFFSKWLFNLWKMSFLKAFQCCGVLENISWVLSGVIQMQL